LLTELKSYKILVFGNNKYGQLQNENYLKNYLIEIEKYNNIIIDQVFTN
jgi:hypothetical protein